jgi:pimeloyl-ACP methyl ester carboxylesterase
MVYRIARPPAGSGPPVVLIHGMLNSSSHWRSVALSLAGDYTVIAPDLIGHGDSAAPRGDYSLGAHAASIRDLLAAIGIERASIVGHSLGGGVAMQFFYQFPQRTERLVLISSGGLGHEVSPVLRTAAHFPHLEDPEGLSEVLREFIQSTRPGMIDDADWGAVLSRRSPPRRVGEAAA